MHLALYHNRGLSQYSSVLWCRKETEHWRAESLGEEVQHLNIFFLFWGESSTFKSQMKFQSQTQCIFEPKPYNIRSTFLFSFSLAFPVELFSNIPSVNVFVANLSVFYNHRKVDLKYSIYVALVSLTRSSHVFDLMFSLQRAAGNLFLVLLEVLCALRASLTPLSLTLNYHARINLGKSWRKPVFPVFTHKCVPSWQAVRREQ